MVMRSISIISVGLILVAISALVAHAATIAFGGGYALLKVSDPSVFPTWYVLLQFLGPLLVIAPVVLAWCLFISRARFSALVPAIVGALGAGYYLYYFWTFNGILAFLLL